MASLEAGPIPSAAVCGGVLRLPCALLGVREALLDEPSDPKQDERPSEDTPDEAQDVELLENLFPMEKLFPMEAPISFST